MELAWGQPLAAVLGESLGSTYTSWYRLAWCMAATWRQRQPRLSWERFLGRLPRDITTLGAQMVAMVDEAITPLCPVPEDSSARFEGIRWSALQFEGRHLLRQSETEWWRSTFRVQQALLWEYGRHHDPEGKSGRPMAEWEIEAVNQRNMALMMGVVGHGNETHSHWTG